MLDKIRKLLGVKRLPEEVTPLYQGARDEREALVLLKESRRRDEARRRRALQDLEELDRMEEELLEEGRLDLTDNRRLMIARRVKDIRWKMQDLNHRIENIYNKRLRVLNEHVASLETVLELKAEALPDRRTMEEMAIKAKQLLEDLDKTRELAEGISLSPEAARPDDDEKEILRELEAAAPTSCSRSDMSILGKFFKSRRGLLDLSLEEIRVEEKRLEIRENQHLRKMETYDKQREEIFHQGAKTKSPARRRIYARRFGECSQRVALVERELTRVVKELMTLTRVRGILERKRQVPVRNVLEKLSDAELGKLSVMLEDDKISGEVYLQKLDTVLGVVNDPAYDSGEIGDEGLEVLKTWEQMDEGEIEFGEGLKEATSREASKGTREAREEDREAGDAEPA
jgi:hypothetical protein